MAHTLNRQAQLLVTNHEKVLYIGSHHPVFGMKWLWAAAACLLVGLPLSRIAQGNFATPILIAAAAAAVFFFALYRLPFNRSFFVVTSHRALIGVGTYTLVQEQILPYQLEDWELRQNYFESFLNLGHLTLRVLEGRQLRLIEIPYLNEPHIFTRYLDELSPVEKRAGKESFDTEVPEKPHQPLEDKITQENAETTTPKPSEKSIPSNFNHRPPPSQG